MTRTADQLKARRLEKMRAGQQAGAPVALLSDPEERMLLVPLTQGEYIRTLEVSSLLAVSENLAGGAAQDETQRCEIIAMSCREVQDPTEFYFSDSQAVRELEAHDINHIFDSYLEMVADQNPSILGLSEEDFSDLKKALKSMQWSELSGPQWYAAQRFLNSIRPLLLTGSLPGSSSTRSLTESKS